MGEVILDRKHFLSEMEPGKGLIGDKYSIATIAIAVGNFI